eukprot:CAMPEP_0181233856 /NCGR_PEP_ID=MMETSP1096-20121128/36597_1 /TAXON_ID=156174 ORGANISM="Chrysochromulina ericina, Strain CCMP281" /NCGR_SAMPLE_ID=MMETSP1096 /ASSEMBLY_ACC=CAM_ASM_000453 /LENGTH=39 /DNA_ID= /DNA_START= /DNA_END= /DNA_ORIENTATION=
MQTTVGSSAHQAVASAGDGRQDWHILVCVDNAMDDLSFD